MTTKRPPSLAETARQRIRALRVERGITQEQLCEQAGISIDAVSRIEGGSRVPTLDTLERLAQALGVRVVDLLAATAPPRSPLAPPLQRIVSLLQREPKAPLDAAEEMLRVLLKVLRRQRDAPQRRR